MRVALAAALLLAAGGCSKRVTLLHGLGSAPPKTVVIRGAKVFDGASLGEARDVLLADGNIAQVGDVGTLTGEELVDGTGKTLLPGLIDLHLHAGALQGEPPWAVSLLDPPSATEQLAAALYCGVTTVLLAGHEADSEALAQAERAGEIASPRLFRASRIFAAKGGHPEGLYSAALPWPVSAIFTGRAVIGVTGPEQGAEELRAEVALHQPSVIKIVYDDLPPGKPRHSIETLRALIAEAKAQHLRAVVHVGGPEEAVTAATEGASLLMHTPWEAVLSDDQVRALAQARVPLLTTVRVWGRGIPLLRGPATDFTPLEKAVMQPGLEEVFAKGPPPGFQTHGFSDAFFDASKVYGPVTGENLKKLRAAGVPLLLGTDSGVTGIFQGAAVHRELAALVALGFGPEEALAMGTARAGEFLAPGSGLGTIAAGAPGDVVLVDGDPVSDITVTEKIVGVWHRGKRVR